jgi:hypothetical protein
VRASGAEPDELEPAALEELDDELELELDWLAALTLTSVVESTPVDSHATEIVCSPGDRSAGMVAESEKCPEESMFAVPICCVGLSIMIGTVLGSVGKLSPVTVIVSPACGLLSSTPIAHCPA